MDKDRKPGTEAEIDSYLAELNAEAAKIDPNTKNGKEKKKLRELNEEIGKWSSLRRTMGKPVVKEELVLEAKAKEEKATTKPKSTTTSTKAARGAEQRLNRVEEKSIETANEMNSGEAIKQKTMDANSAAQTAKKRADQIDANVEENVPTWFWKEAREMAPTDGAKRGFIITNHLLNRLGNATKNIGAVVQNAGGSSGGAYTTPPTASYIDQYRQNKLEQALSNRRTKQNSLLQQQVDALTAIGVPENEARAVQNRLRNSHLWNRYNRLTNEQQVYIQGLLYSDAAGQISDGVLGNFIDQLMEGKNVNMEQAAVNVLTAGGIDNIDNLKTGASQIKDKVFKWLNWRKPGE